MTNILFSKKIKEKKEHRKSELYVLHSGDFCKKKKKKKVNK